MDQVNYNCSTKDIPTPTKKEYRIQLIYRVKKFFDNICWRVWHYKNPNSKEKKETFGFPGTGKVPRDDDLKDLESDLYDLIESIEFRAVINKYQKELHSKIDAIKNETKIIVPADKTSNFYKVEQEEYNNLVEKTFIKSTKRKRKRK